MSDGDSIRTMVVPGTQVDEKALRERLDPGLVNARYRVARRIGKGGMGEVMAARDEQIGRDVAIKRMRAAAPSERAIQRFVREASIQGRLEHPAIVPVHEIGRDTDGLPFFVMKKLAGTTLAQILEDQKTQPATPKFSLQQILRAFAEVCLAVEFAHVRGVVHRDLKPDNIMLGDFGEVYVLDWGVAKIAGEHDDDFSDVDSSGGSGEHATVAGTTIGTPGYMAPEQVRGADIDGRTDVYTLGCLLYEILAGEALHPRGYEGLQSALLRNDNRPSERAPDRGIPPELDALCAQATTPDREVRVQTARELGDRVQRFLDGDRDVAMRRSLAREHLETARAEFEASFAAELDASQDHRSAAMREAAAALALDPAHPAAAELVARLMLEPPKTTPAEVQSAITADDIGRARVNAQAGLLAVGAGLVFMPVIWWAAPADSLYMIALVAMMVVLGGVSFYNLKTARPKTGLVVVGNAIIIVIIARGWSPILIAPGLAAVLAMALVFTPRFSWLGSHVSIAGSLIIAVLGPWALERAGVLDPTMSVSEAGVLFDSPAIGGDPLPVMIVGTLYMALLIIGASSIGEIMRRRTREAHRTLLMQAWQLRQLVPRTG
ncbi:MAG: serine/threonine-protein kinase [Kofleriaceae bacterium]